MDINNYAQVKKWLNEHIGMYRSGEEFDLLVLLLQNHPSYNDWKLNTPLAFKVVMKKSLQLMVSFKVNRYRIVSWVRCCKKIKSIDPLTSAMRHAIKRQISIYKNKNPLRTCSICHTSDKIEVDHYPLKFLTLKDNFIILHPNKPTSFRYHGKRGYNMFHKKEAWKTLWQKYHLKLASYRYLCSTCNKKY